MKLDVINKRSVVTILVILASGNGVWWITSSRSIILIAAAAYAVVAFEVWRRNDYRAGLMIGIAGFAIHAAEAAVHGKDQLGSLESVWLYANIVLPAALVWLSWILIRRIRISGTEKNDNEKTDCSNSSGTG